MDDISKELERQDKFELKFDLVLDQIQSYFVEVRSFNQIVPNMYYIKIIL